MVAKIKDINTIFSHRLRCNREGNFCKCRVNDRMTDGSLGKTRKLWGSWEKQRLSFGNDLFLHNNLFLPREIPIFEYFDRVCTWEEVNRVVGCGGKVIIYKNLCAVRTACCNQKSCTYDFWFAIKTKSVSFSIKNDHDCGKCEKG